MEGFVLASPGEFLLQVATAPEEDKGVLWVSSDYGRALAAGKELVQHLKDYLTWRAHLPAELSIHAARHSLAVFLLKKTGNLRLVQKQLGHSSPVTTATMYADVPFDDMQSGLSGLYDE